MSEERALIDAAAGLLRMAKGGRNVFLLARSLGLFRRGMEGPTMGHSAVYTVVSVSVGGQPTAWLRVGGMSVEHLPDNCPLYSLDAHREPTRSLLLEALAGRLRAAAGGVL